jgi:hypothetical protein
MSETQYKRNVSDDCIVLMARVLDSYNVGEIQVALARFGGRATPARIVQVIQRTDPCSVRDEPDQDFLALVRGLGLRHAREEVAYTGGNNR